MHLFEIHTCFAWWVSGGFLVDFLVDFFDFLVDFRVDFLVDFFVDFFLRPKYICFNMYLGPEKIHRKIHQEIHRVFPCAFFGVVGPKIFRGWETPWADTGATAFAPIRSLPP